MRRPRLALSAVICVLPLALAACGESTPITDARIQAPLVRTAVVQDASGSSRSFTGTVAARVQSDLGFRVPGKVLERLVDTGQAVKRGQLLMRIDPVDLKLAAEAQHEAVAAARARAQQTADDELRYRDLRGTGAISTAAYDQVKAAADAAKAQLSAAEAQASVARNASRYAELIADADGVVTETLAEPGQVVVAGQPVVRLAHAGHREAVVQLPETLRPAIGAKAEARLFGSEGAGSPVKLRQLSSAADRLTRTFEARYVLDGALANAPLGATVTVQMADEPSTGHPALQVPIASVFDAGKGPGVWVVSGSPTKITWRTVTIKRVDDERAQVVDGVKRGEIVVALGAHLLREGAQVRVMDPAVAAANNGSRP
ncbi:efflux RND transporter periplasmic adaptor subunit [Roseateles sp. LYH14W]|uniref:Efflux RND transporter periplasmic adaptor subunit n=1 Tax=Pelomonas parva TaxID=3299032 RepID=A0ABW7F2M0_9BURK